MLTLHGPVGHFGGGAGQSSAAPGVMVGGRVRSEEHA
jgi:hypothetical protein